MGTHAKVNQLTPDTLSVASGGILNIESGGELQFAGTNVATQLAAAVATPVAGIAASYVVARGETALDGTNPTAVATGLTTIVSFVCSLKGSAAPGLSTSCLSATVSAGTASVYAWKPTGAGDTTLIASTGTESFYWVAVGTV